MSLDKMKAVQHSMFIVSILGMWPVPLLYKLNCKVESSCQIPRTVCVRTRLTPGA